MAPVDNYLGRGIAFPPRVGSDGRLAWSDGEQNIREAIEIVLRTDLDERLRLPEFGVGLKRRFLFEPNTAATHHRLEDEVTKALAAWEPRIVVESVTARPDRGDNEAAKVEIVYRLVATQSRERAALTVPLTG